MSSLVHGAVFIWLILQHDGSLIAVLSRPTYRGREATTMLDLQPSWLSYHYMHRGNYHARYNDDDDDVMIIIIINSNFYDDVIVR